MQNSRFRCFSYAKQNKSDDFFRKSYRTGTGGTPRFYAAGCRFLFFSFLRPVSPYFPFTSAPSTPPTMAPLCKRCPAPVPRHNSLVQKLSARTRPHHSSLVQRELSCASMTEGLSPRSSIYLIKNRPSYPLRLALLDTSPFQKGRHGERRPSPACLPFIKKQIGHPTNRFNSVHFSFSPIDKPQKICYIVDRNYTFTRKLTDKGENL